MVAETSKWYTAAIQAQPMKVLVETKSSGQILRESFQVAPQVSGKPGLVPIPSLCIFL